MAKSIKDELDEFEASYDKSPIENEMDSFEREQEKAPTVEDRYLGEIYKGMGHVSVLTKPAAFMATPVLEAVRAPFKYAAENIGEPMSQTPDIDTAAEYEGLHPSNRFTTTNLLTDIANSVGIRTSSLAKIQSKDFPKAANFAENMTNPTKMGGAVLDIALASKIPEVVAPTLDRSKMALNYLRAKSKDKELLLKMEQSGKAQDAAKYMAENPDEYIRPFSSSKTLDYIEGPVVTTKDVGGMQSTVRDASKGKIGKLLEEQNQAIEDIPQVYEVPKHEMAIMAKTELAKKGLLPTQVSAAEKIIDDIMGVIQPSKDKINLIEDVEMAGRNANDLAKQIADETVARVMGNAKEISAQTRRLDGIPEQLPNPNYREDLQWLSQLPVEEGGNIFPRERIVNESTVTPTQKPSFTGGQQPAPYNVTTEQVYGGRADPLQTVSKNQKMLDIAQGKQLEPQMIPNEQHALVLADVQDRIADLNGQIEMLQNGKLQPRKKYSQLYKLNKEKRALDKFYYENLDDSALGVNAYMAFIDKQNMKPIGFASDIRRRGNSLMSAVGNETPQEMGSAQAAGAALEKVGRSAQDQAMAMGPDAAQAVYQGRNKEIAANISIRDLMSKQRISNQNKFNVPVMDMARGVARQAIDLNAEYISPYVAKGKQAAVNIGAQAMNTLKYPLPLQLIEFQIPRNSNDILANKDVVLAKIAQMSNDPVMTEMFADALSKHPEKLKKVLPALIMKFPDLFEDDDYNRVDGKVYDPRMKQKAINDIQNNKTMPLRERAFKIKRLQQEGLLD